MKTNTLVLPTSYVTVDNSTVWLPADTYTYEFWAMRTASGASLFNAMPYIQAYIDSGNSSKLTLQIQAGSLQQITTSYVPTLNQWHQYQITRDSTGHLTVYVDGTVIAGPTATSNPVGSPPTQLVMGFNAFWNGNLKFGDFRVWNYARTAAELAGNAAHWIDGNDNGLVANWNFADGTGIGGVQTSTVNDVSWGPSDPTQHNGVIVDPNSDSTFTSNDSPVNIRPEIDVAAPLVEARLDFGYLAQVAHLEMLLNNGLTVYGLNCDVYDKSVFANEYGMVPGVAPEYKPTQVPITRIRIMMGQPFDGIMLNDYISISDKTTKEFKITTSYQLQEQQVLRVYYPDGKTVHLRVVAALALHPLTSMGYNFQCVAV